MKQIIELVKRIKGSGRSNIIQHSELMDMAESLVKGYDGSWRELALIGDRIENLGKKILDESKANAHVEAQLDGQEGKHEFMGNQISLRTYQTYEYQPTPYISKLEEDLDQISQKIKPLKDQEKAVKSSIKSAHKQQEADGTAELVETKNSIAISRK